MARAALLVRPWIAAVLLWLLASFASPRLLAQDSVPTVTANFNRQNDFTYFTLMNLHYPYQKGKYSFDLNLYHNNIYNSSLTEGSFAQLQIQTQLWQYLQIKPKLDFTSWLETDQFINTKTQRFNLYGGMRWRPDSGLVLIPLIGYSLDIRNGRPDPGITPAFKGEHFKQLPLGLFTQTQIFARYKHIQPRQQRNVSMVHLWGKQFGKEARIVAGVGGGSHEMDDYVSESVKRINTDSIAPFLKWDYQLVKGLTWTSNNDFQAVRRQFRYVRLDSNDNVVDPATAPLGTSVAEFNNLSFQEIIANTQQQVTWLSRSMEMRGGFEYQYYTRTYSLDNNRMDLPLVYETQLKQEKQKDFGKQLARLSAEATYHPGKRQRVTAKVMNTYLRWDTPSKDNYDDRDELSWYGGVDLNSRWTKTFSTQVSLSGNWRQYAFLYKERSAENYVQRFLRTDFQFGWDILPRLRLEGENAVYVTYNVKDFADGNRTDRSTRNLETNGRLVWRPISRLECKFIANRKEIHQSYLNWKEFSETNLDTNTIYTLEQANRYQFRLKQGNASLFADVGYRQFNQTKRFPSNMVLATGGLMPISLHQINLQTGPLLGIGFRSKNQSTLDFSVWFQNHIRKYRYFEADKITVLGLSYTHAELDAVNQKLKPFVVLTASIRLGSVTPGRMD